ncbi:LOW QUALITY PROTEIN: PPR domain-containing protein/PPR_2 domain-containing protein, partial [Cephalotus follicularis]
GIKHDFCTLIILINCFCRLSRLHFGFSILGKMLKLGLEPDSVTFNTLINGLCIGGQLLQAVRLSDGGVGCKPDAFTYSTILNGLCKMGNSNVAVKLLKKMEQRGVEPDLVTHSAIIDSLCKDKLITDAFNIFSEMKNKGILPDFTFNILVDGLCKEGLVSDVDDSMIQRGEQPNIFIYSFLMDGYCLGSQNDEARKVFDLIISIKCLKKD